MRRTAPLLLATLAIAGAIVVAACTLLARTTPPYNVLLVSVDTLRADRLHCFGNPRETSPSIDTIARDGVIFRQTSAQKGQTWPSLTSILTGQYPITHGVRKNGDTVEPSHKTIAEILSAQGYETGAFIANMTTAPNRGFKTYFTWEDSVQEQTIWDREVTAAAVKWLRAMPRGQRFFGWVHMMDPHKPYHPPEPYDVAFDADYKGEFNGDDDPLDDVTLGRREITPHDLEHVIALYDGQVLSTDRYVGRILKVLETTGLLENTLVVFVSDHGEELCDHQHYFYHTCSMFDGVTRIALAMRLPAALPKGKVVDAQVEEIDIVPTILEIMDLPVPRDVQGESLLPLVTGRGERKNQYAYIEYVERPEEGRILAIRDGHWKFIHNPSEVMPKNPPFDPRGPGGFRYEKCELYDLTVDPHEQHNLCGEKPELVAELKAKLMAWYLPLRKNEGKAGRMSALSREKLKGLGYIGDEHEVTLHLKDGTSVEGRLVNESATEYVVDTDQGLVSVPKVQVQSKEDR
ncbi:MAG: sulfatase [Planctomycetes bacterium]|nr:sulfatase [Planctomycetota bacterium]